MGERKTRADSYTNLRKATGTIAQRGKGPSDGPEDAKLLETVEEGTGDELRITRIEGGLRRFSERWPGGRRGYRRPEHEAGR